MDTADKFRKRKSYRGWLADQIQRADGNAFQKLFAGYMKALHGDDFLGARPAGPKGDFKCDGYQPSTKTVYQCFGKERSSQVNARHIEKKIREDFAGAKDAFGDEMLNWRFVHNIVDELPAQCIIAIQELKAANPGITIAVMDPNVLETRLFTLPDSELDRLLDIPEDSWSGLDPNELQMLLKNMLADGQATIHDPDLRAVPVDKIEANGISELAGRAIRDNTRYAGQVEKFVREDADPLFGDKIAAILGAQYSRLRTRDRSADEILQDLIFYIAGNSLDPAFSTLKTAEAIFAYFFSECDVFENLSVRS